MRLTSVLSCAATAGLASASAITPARRNVLSNVYSWNASEMEIKFQPGLDFDGDCCYQTAVMNQDGVFNDGAPQTGTHAGTCRDEAQLDNSNTYARTRCNNGICGIVYTYYFEKSQVIRGGALRGPPAIGYHRHQWLSIVVFVKDDAVIRIVPAHCSGIEWRGQRPKRDGTEGWEYDFHHEDNHGTIVYHLKGQEENCFRFANDADMGTKENPGIENVKKVWWRAPLLGWGNNWAGDHKDSFLQTWGKDSAMDDTAFGQNLEHAANGEVPGFDPWKDE